MATFILIEDDPFVSNLRREGSSRAGTMGVASGNYVPVSARRPLRGVLAKPETPSTIHVMNANGDLISLWNSSVRNDGGPAPEYYANYLLDSVNETRQEKAQIIETFGQPYGFFYGERPRILQCTGKLINTPDFNWRSEWWANYEDVFRATRLVELDARMYLSWESIIVEGYMLSSQVGTSANDPNVVPMSFSLFITNYTDISSIGDNLINTTGWHQERYRDPETGEIKTRSSSVMSLGDVTDNTDEYLSTVSNYPFSAWEGYIKDPPPELLTEVETPEEIAEEAVEAVTRDREAAPCTYVGWNAETNESMDPVTINDPRVCEALISPEGSNQVADGPGMTGMEDDPEREPRFGPDDWGNDEDLSGEPNDAVVEPAMQYRDLDGESSPIYTTNKRLYDEQNYDSVTGSGGGRHGLGQAGGLDFA